MNSFRTVLERAQAEITEKKSRFTRLMMKARRPVISRRKCVGCVEKERITEI